MGPTAPGSQEHRFPARFDALMRASKRDREVSRAILALLRADGCVSRALEEALAPAGLTLPKFNVLMELASSPDGRLPLHEIVRRLVKSAPNISALIDRLEADGLVCRSRESSDRRVVTASLTNKGWDALRRGGPPLFEAEKRVLEEITPQDRETLARLLEAIAEPRGAGAGRPDCPD